ncbi:exodeoxyribonuclease V subunit alpha [Ramlibacter sp. XY19]|uniref:exodeoxyribonuclease V subunit alpha n=1 Tax=Ramlibacter paludis TaxID=2908000 RepID=UPI0023DCDC8F|nr:exodeoxyribonuclease V subunit alpha [Ramlibacter paludis]MCG2593439.1 exodeoxyribonuclease V subunit alpha [Ramlibacter paludis]
MKAMLEQLARWVEAGWLRDLDQAFAAFLAREAPDADPLLLLAAALASHQLGRGHACLELAATLADAAATLALPPEDSESIEPTPADLLAKVSLKKWQQALAHPRLVGAGAGNTPLVLEGTRFYLRRYWQHERTVQEAIALRLSQVQKAAPDGRALRAALDALFRPVANGETDWQKVACALAARQGFSIVTGGPGTGKTTTVVKLLAVLQHLALGEGGGRLRIRLAAPTGKAAARLNASIAGTVQGLPLAGLPDAETLRAAIPTEVTTVHRLLGSRPDTRHFRHDARNPLPVDVLVLDEASMVDLEMMAAVLLALPAQARLVLLGDKDQLASVEAGAVLGALCRRADAGHYTQVTRDWVLAATGERIPDALLDADGAPLDQAVTKLRKSHRFTTASGIGRLADAVNAGDIAGVRKLERDPPADIAFATLGSDDAALRRLVLEGPQSYRHYLEVMGAQQPPLNAQRPAFDAWAAQVLAAYGAFQLLCAVRKGPQGVERLNQRVAAMLHHAGLLRAAGGWTLGRPVMVTRNDYALGLMNGDVGITLALPQEVDGVVDWKLRVAFAASDGSAGIRWVLPSRLQAVETVFAMTVHKSQGSEFAHAALVLPDRMSRVLTRELVYTGITRAKQRFTLAQAGDAAVLEEAVTRRMERAGGLLA